MRRRWLVAVSVAVSVAVVGAAVAAAATLARACAASEPLRRALEALMPPA